MNHTTYSKALPIFEVFVLIRDDTHMKSMKIVKFSRPHLPCPAMSKIFPPP